MFLEQLTSQRPLIQSPTLSALGIVNNGSSTNGIAMASCQHPLCCDVEGWGPLSKVISDFTPCFLDFLISLVGLFGLLYGSYSLWCVATKNRGSEVSKGWQLWTKLVSEEDLDHSYLSISKINVSDMT
jgi:hypothetical protein